MRRAPQETRTYFLTIVTAQRKRIFQVDDNARLIMDLLAEDRHKGRFDVHAFVIMPDHLHLLLTPAPEISLEKSIQFIKGGFSFRLRSKLDVWERGYNEVQVRSAEQFDGFCNYIAQNPVRKGLATKAEEFPYGSAGKPELVDPRPAWFQNGPGLKPLIVGGGESAG